MADQQLADLFRYKWSRPGGLHWVFNDMRECVDVWQKRGVDGLPASTPGAVALLAPDLQKGADWHARLRATLT